MVYLAPNMWGIICNLEIADGIKVYVGSDGAPYVPGNFGMEFLPPTDISIVSAIPESWNAVQQAAAAGAAAATTAAAAAAAGAAAAPENEEDKLRRELNEYKQTDVVQERLAAHVKAEEALKAVMAHKRELIRQKELEKEQQREKEQQQPQYDDTQPPDESQNVGAGTSGSEFRADPGSMVSAVAFVETFATTPPSPEEKALDPDKVEILTGIRVPSKKNKSGNNDDKDEATEMNDDPDKDEDADENQDKADQKDEMGDELAIEGDTGSAA